MNGPLYQTIYVLKFWLSEQSFLNRDSFLNRNLSALCLFLTIEHSQNEPIFFQTLSISTIFVKTCFKT